MLRNEPGDEEIIQSLDNALSTLDAERRKGLEKMQQLQAIKQASLEKEKTRLGEKYGADHPKVEKISKRISDLTGSQTELTIEVERSSIEVPDFNVNTWMVHGRVLDQDKTPLSGLTVSLSDADNKWFEPLGHACTNEKGYYAIRYQVEEGEESKIPADKDLFLTVTDNELNLLHRETEPVNVEIGQIDLRIIMIDNLSVCEPPEQANDDSNGTVIPGDAWIVRGTVHYDDKSPGAGLIVSVYDKDLLFDDKLGTTQTNDDGRFELVYQTKDFRDLIERKPDLYLKVLNREGNVLYNSKKSVRSEAGRTEEFKITLSKGEKKS